MTTDPENTSEDRVRKIISIPPVFNSIAPVQWIQLDMLRPGDLLVVNTEVSLYLFSVTGSRTALMVSSNPSVAGAEVTIHGCMGNSADDVAWGKLLPGKGLVFGALGSTDSLCTSPITLMKLRKCSFSVSTISPRPTTPATPVTKVPYPRS